MSLKPKSWQELAGLALKVTMAIVVPSAATVANPLIDLTLAIAGTWTSDPREQIGNKRSKSLETLLATQLASLDEFETDVSDNEKLAALDVVKGLLKEIDISYVDLEAADFDPEIMYNRGAHECRVRLRNNLLGEPGFEFGLALFRLSIRQIASLVSTMPFFERKVSLETYLLAKRTPERIVHSLETIVVPSSREGTSKEQSEFDAEYRSAIIRKHSRVEQFGLDDVPPALRWQPLEATYISLVASKLLSPAALQSVGHSRYAASDLTNLKSSTRHTIEEIVSSSSADFPSKQLRLVVSGQAGSGKTTVVKWLSTCCALGAKSPTELGFWNGAVPFPVNLSSAIPPGSRLMPGTNALIQSIGFSASQPAGWLEAVLKNEKSLIFFDGLDELPPDRRAIGKDWIRDICERYPRCGIVVSSRPEAIDPHFFGENEFGLVSIQPLSYEQAQSCMSRWFNAQCDPVPVDRAEVFRSRERSLIHHFEIDPNIRDLSESPLLVAMLCAYYASGSSVAPIDRVKLISNVTNVLVDRRDRERGVIPPDMISFTLERKLQLLGQIASSLFTNAARSVRILHSNGSSAILIEDDILALMPPGPGLDTESTVRYVLDRSMVFSAIGSDEARFAHALFLEHLAGYQFAQQERGSELLEMSSLPGWYSVASFYCAGSTGNQSTIFIRDLLLQVKHSERAMSDQRRMVYCLVECLGSSRAYDENLYRQVSVQLQASLPPQSPEEVALLASLGPAAISMLPIPTNSSEAAAYVATARRIRGEPGLGMLEDFANGAYASDLAPHLVSAWTDFDAEEYALRVLSRLGAKPLSVSVRTVECAKSLRHLHNVTEIALGPCEGLTDLKPFASCQELTSLDLKDARRLKSLEGIQGLTALRRLRLPARGVDTLLPLALSSNLTEVRIENCSGINSLSPLRGLKSLRTLSISSVSPPLLRELSHGFERIERLACHGSIAEFGFLEGLPKLVTLRVESILDRGVTGGEAIARLSNLKLLDLKLNSAKGPVRLPLDSKISVLTLSGEIQLDLNNFQENERLAECKMRGKVTWWSSNNSAYAAPLTDMLAFSKNRRLRVLEISNNPGLYYAKGIEQCSQLAKLILNDCDQLEDLTPLNDLKQLVLISLLGSVPREPFETLRSRAGLHIEFDDRVPAWQQEAG